MHDLAAVGYFGSWDPTFRRKYVAEWPRSYMCLDTEFDSMNSKEGLIWEIGHAIVRDGVVVSRGNYVLNWYETGLFDAGYLDGRLADIARRVGFDWRLTPQVVKQEGGNAVKILKFYKKLFDSWASADGPFVLQNGQNADEVLFDGNFRRFLSSSFVFPEHTYFDVGCLFKAFQAWQNPQQFGGYQPSFRPTGLDTPKSYYRRVSGVRAKGLKWKLGLMVDTFSLQEKHGSGPANYHNALYDAECLHWAMIEFGNLYSLAVPSAAATQKLDVNGVATIVMDELSKPAMFGYPPGKPPEAPVRQRNV